MHKLNLTPSKLIKKLVFRGVFRADVGWSQGKAIRWDGVSRRLSKPC